jgi:hypothetical protein
MQMFKQLPKTVGELESGLDQGDNNLMFRDQATQLIANDKETSVGVMRDWIKNE